MQSSGIFDEDDKKKSSYFLLYVIGFVALLIFAGIGYYFYQQSAPKYKTAEQVEATDIRDSTVFMLAQPSFSSDEFRSQILGKGRLQRIEVFEQTAFFIYPESSDEEFEEFTSKYFYHKKQLEMAKEANGRMYLGSYWVGRSPAAGRLFKTKINNVKLDTTQVLNFPFSNSNYEVSLAELKDYANNSRIYGGNLRAASSVRSDEPQYMFANHGIMVSKPDEPSLNRLIGQLMQGVADNREAKIQRLVDFVSNEIEYSFTEATAPQEKLKRASEVLMTRSADCSNKTILLASLLEQINEPYILLYYPRHITVAVPQGGFSNENKLDFTWEQKNWVIAETTAAGFQIGTSMLQDDSTFRRVNFVQNPKLSNVIYDAHSYEVLKFL